MYLQEGKIGIWKISLRSFWLKKSPQYKGISLQEVGL